MMNEKKTAPRTGADRDSFTDISVPTNSGLAGGTPADPPVTPNGPSWRSSTTKTPTAKHLTPARSPVT